MSQIDPTLNLDLVIFTQMHRKKPDLVNQKEP